MADNNTRMVMDNPLDGETLALAVENIRAAVALNMTGAPADAVNIEADGQVSKLEAARIGVVAVGDPIRAMKEARGSELLIGSDRAARPDITSRWAGCRR